ncbi:MAG: hypothetical protein H8D22_08835 [Candidatus Cloacimonetes bacterium]|nr:hypothetical protein [Candidatus Cloacimonadota bacterium]
MKRIFYTTITIILFVYSILWSENSLKVTEMTEDYIQLHLHIDEYNFLDVNIRGQIYQSIELPGIKNYIFNEEEKPQLPFFSKIIGLPPDGNVSANIISETYEILENINIPYNPTYIEQGDILVPKYSVVPSIYRKPSYFPEQLVETEIAGYVGNRYLGSVRIFPIQFNPVEKKVKIYSDIIINIVIRGDKKKSSPRFMGTNYIDKVADDLIINNQYSENWKKERESSIPPRGGQNDDVINSFKLMIEQKGIYKITYSFLKDTISFWQDSLQFEYQFNFDIDEMNPKYINLINKGTPVPIYFYGESDDSFDEGDYFEFYADMNHGENCFYDNYSWENCYFLEYKEGEFGARLAVEDCGLYETDPRKYKRPSYFDTTIHLESQSQYSKLTRVKISREDYWFMQEISAPSMASYSFNLYNPEQTSARAATINVSLFGKSYYDTDPHTGVMTNTGDHHALIYINASQIGSEYWNGQTEVIISGSPSNDKLNDGSNTIYISMPGDTEASWDVIFLNYIDINYWRECIAHDNILEFNKPSFNSPGLFQFEINEFTTSEIEVYKIGISKLENVSIESTMPEGGPPFLLTFQDEVIDDTTKYIALSEEHKLLPKLIIPDIPSNLYDINNQADYLLISIREFINTDAVDEFVYHWEEYKGLNVKPIALEDIFNEFNYGIRSAKAIKDFLKYAYNNWQEPAVQYVLFLGDACNDERDTSPKKKYSIVPTKMSWTYHFGATVDDNWFVSIVGDDELPDLAIGRIPIWEKEQIAPVLEKTIQYNTEPNFNDVWRNHCMLIAGGAGIFEEQNERLKKKYIPDEFRVSRIYAQRPHNDPYWGGTTRLKDYIDDGTAFIQFLGHGGGQIWSDLNLMNLADISTLFNDNYPIISSLTCYTSNFEYAPDEGYVCLGQAFIVEPERGAIGFFGGAGKGFLEQDEVLAEYMFNNLFNRGMRNFAELSNLAKIEYSINHSFNYYVIKTFIRGFNYMGDPAIDIVLPSKQLNTSLNSYEFVIGDTVQIHINNTDSTLNRIAYYVTDEQDLIPNPYNPEEKQQVELYNINREYYDASGYEYIIDTTNTASQFTRIVRTYGYNDTSDYIGHTIFTVGQSAIFDITTDPSPPCLGDSVKISAKIFDKDGVDTVRCIWWTNPIERDTILMHIQQEDTLTYLTQSPISAFLNKTTVNYCIEVIDDSLNQDSSGDIQYTVTGPDIDIESFENTISNDSTYFEVNLFNRGDITSSPAKLFIKNNQTQTKIDSTIVDSLFPMCNNNILFPCNFTTGIYNLTAFIFVNGDIVNYCDEPSVVFDVYGDKTIEIASRFTSDELGDNVGDVIAGILFYTPTYSSECNVTIKIYEGGSPENPPGNLVYEAPLGYFSANEWVDHIPSILIKIKPQTEYWIGCEIHTYDGKVAWMDSGPSATGKGDWWLSPSGWALISQYPHYNRNWLIRMFLCSSFFELDYSNNELTREFQINNFIVSPDSSSVHSSLDSNLVVTFPEGLVDNECYFYIHKYQDSDTSTVEQPDISQIVLRNGEKASYEIGIFDSTQLNADGAFKNNKKIDVKFYYSQTDSLTQDLATQGNFKIYRYEPELNYWFLIGGDINLKDNKVSYTFVDRPGIYSLFQNNDTTVPTIDVNVEGQEFTNGEYVDDQAIFSFIIQDNNGIDTEKIKLFLNGEAVSNYSLSTQNLNSVPVKYQIDVDVGTYTIIISANDANGNYNESTVNFSVQKEFNIIHIGNYPNPVSLNTIDPVNEGRTRFTYTLTNDADEVKIKIFTVSGRLVNIISDLPTTVGYHEYPHAIKGWMCVDFDNRKLANGVYFYKIIATKGKKSIEKIEKLAIVR